MSFQSRSLFRRRLSIRVCSLIMSLTLWKYRNVIVSIAVASCRAIVEHVIVDFEWFQTATPAGIKLYSPLCRLFGSLGALYMTFVLETVPMRFVANLVLWTMIPCLVLLGVDKVAILLAWGVRLCSLPVTLLYAVVTLVYRMHLSATIYFWSVLRGKYRLSTVLETVKAAVAGNRTPMGQSSRRRSPRKLLTNDPSTPNISPLRFPMTSCDVEETSAVDPFRDLDSPSLDVCCAVLLWIPLSLTLPTTAWFAFFAACLHGCCFIAAESAAFLVEICKGNVSIDSSDGYTLGVLHALWRVINGRWIALSAWQATGATLRHVTRFLPASSMIWPHLNAVKNRDRRKERTTCSIKRQ